MFIEVFHVSPKEERDHDPSVKFEDKRITFDDPMV